ncbi:hypothetical protein EV121DRAFT_298189 [Schizophyllum commune]
MSPPPPQTLRQRIAVRRARRLLAFLSSFRRPTTLYPPSATLKSPPRPLTTPSILVSNFNMSRARSEPTSLRLPLLSSPTLSMIAFALLNAFQPLGKG